MKRSAFTMIELIFVIVILGILAAVAIPKLAGVQDDALAASEKSGIAAARSGVTAIRGRILTRPGKDIVIDVTSSAGDVGTIKYDANLTTETGISLTKYPVAISASAITANTETDPAFAGAEGTGLAMAAVLEPSGRDAWKTGNDGNSTKIAGPASSTIAEGSAEYDVAGSWLYSSDTGMFVYRADLAF